MNWAEKIIFGDPEVVLLDTGVGFGTALGEYLFEESVKEVFLI